MAVEHKELDRSSRGDSFSSSRFTPFFKLVPGPAKQELLCGGPVLLLFLYIYICMYTGFRLLGFPLIMRKHRLRPTRTLCLRKRKRYRVPFVTILHNLPQSSIPVAKPAKPLRYDTGAGLAGWALTRFSWGLSCTNAWLAV